jgi:hypothetical protein
MGVPSMPSLKRADTRGGQPGAFGELLLRQACSIPQPSELSAELELFPVSDDATSPWSPSVYAAEARNESGGAAARRAAAACS